MFTGIISDIGHIISREEQGDTHFVIKCHYAPETIDVGASIACSGVCLTATNKGTDPKHGHWFSVDVSAETLSCTTANTWQEGTGLNLERALRMGDELGGHLVSGHVDAVATISAIEKQGDSTLLRIELPENLMKFASQKGSITVDGISLTINKVEKNSLNLNIIPHTLSVTMLGKAAVGQRVNIEIDLIARYVQRMMSPTD